MKNDLDYQLEVFIKAYSDMNINGKIIHCPYWMNKIKDKKIVYRGFFDGKGAADDIKRELTLKLEKSKANFEIEQLTKFAKRERIGIDCSGFAYRLLNFLLHNRYRKSKLSDLSNLFEGGITKTSARMLTSTAITNPILVKDLILGDLIRMRKGKHVAVIYKVNKRQIIYIHSASFTAEKGVHTATINITDSNLSLEKQKWQEKTRSGGNFAEENFFPNSGDGIFRLRIFA